jgi:hypothetical protein
MATHEHILVPVVELGNRGLSEYAEQLHALTSEVQTQNHLRGMGMEDVIGRYSADTGTTVASLMRARQKMDEGEQASYLVVPSVGKEAGRAVGEVYLDPKMTLHQQALPIPSWIAKNLPGMSTQEAFSRTGKAVNVSLWVDPKAPDHMYDAVEAAVCVAPSDEMMLWNIVRSRFVAANPSYKGAMENSGFTLLGRGYYDTGKNDGKWIGKTALFLR